MAAPLKNIDEILAETTAAVRAAQEAGQRLKGAQERWAEFWVRNEPREEWDVWLQAWCLEKYGRGGGPAGLPGGQQGAKEGCDARTEG